MSKLKWVLLAAFLVFLAFVLDTQLIVLRDEGMFTLHYEVPKDMEGKMFASAYWISDSPMCRQLSFGTGKFEPQGYGTSFDNVEEEPGIWVSHIPTEVWHPFCQWELARMSIGMDANPEKTNYHQLAYAILYEPRDSKPGDEKKQGDSRNRNNESILVCETSEHNFKRIYKDRVYADKSYSYYCKNPNNVGFSKVSGTPYVGFTHNESGKLIIKYSNNKIKYLRKNYFEEKMNKTKSYGKKIKYLNSIIENIHTTIGLEKYWTVNPENGKYKIRIGIPGSKPESEISIQLTQEQLALLASEDVWEVPDFIQQ